MPLVLVFIVVPLLELAVILEIGSLLGTLPTIGLLVLDSLLGALLLRAQGRSAWQRFAVAVRSGRPPANEVLEGALVVAGGALLLTPGFLTDAAGLLLLLPPSRRRLRGALARRLMARMVFAMSTRAPRPPQPPQR